jgi:hypothetical protein
MKTDDNKDMFESTVRQRTRIEDISAAGKELSDEHLRLVSGGARPVYCAACCTMNNDVDYTRDW